MKRIFTCTIILLGILGCTHSSITELGTSIDRVTINQDQYTQPDFYLENEPNLKRASRAPASVLIHDDFKHLSNRQLYFLSSYIHFNSFKESLKLKSSVKSCPMFHDLILSEKSVLKDNYKLRISTDFTKVQKDKSLIVQYPILALPYTSQTDLYSELVNNNWQSPNQYLNEAMVNHFKNTEKEIVSLCETGVSPGYYIYENLVTYFKTQKSFHRTKDGLKALLKVPVIANMLIVDSMIMTDKVNTIGKYNSWLLSRSNTFWVRDYFRSLKNKRIGVLSSNKTLNSRL